MRLEQFTRPGQLPPSATGVMVGVCTTLGLAFSCLVLAANGVDASTQADVDQMNWILLGVILASPLIGVIAGIFGYRMRRKTLEREAADGDAP